MNLFSLAVSLFVCICIYLSPSLSKFRKIRYNYSIILSDRIQIRIDLYPDPVHLRSDPHPPAWKPDDRINIVLLLFLLFLFTMARQRIERSRKLEFPETLRLYNKTIIHYP